MPNRIKQYDKELQEDIRSLKNYIDVHYTDWMGSDWLLRCLKKLGRLFEVLPFRIYLDWPSGVIGVSHPFSIKIITEHDKFYFNTTVLDDYERTKFVEYIYVTFPFNRYMPDYNMHHCYPSVGLVRLIVELRIKYKDEQVLAKMPLKDKRVGDVASRIEVKYDSLDDFGHALLGSSD